MASFDPLRPPVTEPKNEQRQEHRGERQKCPSDLEGPVLPEQDECTSDKEAERTSFPR
jgi:hypothetical protein